MATFQSVQSNVSDNIGTVTITKPVSLAVGDLLLAGIMVDRDAGATASIATPAGWTQEALVDVEGLSRNALGVFSKLADAADVAAANFTFTGTGSTASMSMVGHLARISNWGGKAGQTTGTSSASSTTLTLTGITPSPAIASSLYVIFATRIQASPNVATVSSVAIATSNPTWTQQASGIGNGNTYDTVLALYTATRPETTGTGNYTITYNNTTNAGSAAVALILHTPISGSITPSDTAVNGYAFSPIGKTTVSAIVDNPTSHAMDMPAWTNPDKISTAWTNPDK